MKTRLHIHTVSVLSAMLAAALLSMMLVGCASTSTPASTSTLSASGTSKPERNFNAASLTVNKDSHGRQVFDAIPPESLMERFDAYDTQGRLITYVAFTDTDVGALVFINDRLHGSLSRHDAQSFYSCRGHALVANNQHWSTEVVEWVNSLLTQVRPETSVELEFSGKTTVQSLKEATENPLVGRIRSLLGIGTNPLNVFNTLNTARNDYEASEQFESESKDMNLLTPGMSEMRLAAIAKPQDLAFSGDGMVLAYPSHRVEYFVADGIIRVIQQPSFYTLSRRKPAVFYAPGAQWSRCTPKEWMAALPKAQAPVPAPVQAPVLAEVKKD